MIVQRQIKDLKYAIRYYDIKKKVQRECTFYETSFKRTKELVREFKYADKQNNEKFIYKIFELNYKEIK